MDGTHLTVVRRTLKSVVATQGNEQHGVCVENLPFGVLVVFFSAPQELRRVAAAVEDFANVLRM